VAVVGFWSAKRGEPDRCRLASKSGDFKGAAPLEQAKRAGSPFFDIDADPESTSSEKEHCHVEIGILAQDCFQHVHLLIGEIIRQPRWTKTGELLTLVTQFLS